MSSIIEAIGSDEPYAKITFIQPEHTADGFRVFYCGDQFFQVSDDGKTITDETGCDLKQSDLVLVASAAVSALNCAVETVGVESE